MELKQRPQMFSCSGSSSLNRTFYGIETCLKLNRIVGGQVLIVPFMELKQQNDALLLWHT